MEILLKGEAGTPPANGKHGYSKEVLVLVRCPSGAMLYKLDKFDTLSKTWELHEEIKGYKIVYWFDLPE